MCNFIDDLLLCLSILSFLEKKFVKVKAVGFRSAFMMKEIQSDYLALENTNFHVILPVGCNIWEHFITN